MLCQMRSKTPEERLPYELRDTPPVCEDCQYKGRIDDFQRNNCFFDVRPKDITKPCGWYDSLGETKNE